MQSRGQQEPGHCEKQWVYIQFIFYICQWKFLLPLTATLYSRMRKLIKIGNRVILKSFNGTTVPDGNTPPHEDYWKLIDSIGTVVQDPKRDESYINLHKEKRVLVKFDQIVKSFGLECHNSIENSLWINVNDLDILETGI